LRRRLRVDPTNRVTCRGSEREEIAIEVISDVKTVAIEIVD